MYGPDAGRLFLHAATRRGGKSGPGSALYNSPSPITWPTGSVHSPLDQYFFNFSEPATAALWNDTVLFGEHGLGSPDVDGFFVDDDAFGREHPTLPERCGMDAAAVADFADRQHAALVRSFESVVAAGGMVWDAMRDHGFEARAWGQKAPLNPNPVNCSAWMVDKCGRDFSDHTLLMTDASLLGDDQRQAVATLLIN